MEEASVPMAYADIMHKHYNELTKSEKKVADYVLSVGQKVIYATMTDIKKATHVGDATIVRFCQKLGYSGFTDFKIEIAKEDFPKTKPATSDHYYDHIAQHLSDAIKATAALIKPETLQTAIQMMTNATRIWIFGVGGSGEIAHSLSSILLRSGLKCTPEADPHFQAQIASLLSSTDLVIGISLSGKTKDTYDSLKIGHDNGAKVIAITNATVSPIAQLADVTLQTAIEEFLNGGSVAGRVSQLYICNVLAEGYEQMNHVDALALKERVLRAIIDKSIG